ncbi:MAG: hypothetical protein PF443_02920 [Allgaiera sp.]|jgi:hypothetical protein|nr:hypothetical protein [Allgaiera sp.]
MTGALVRAVLVMVLIATPSTLLPGSGVDSTQIVALIALFGGGLTFVEYSATYPGLIEFRYAPPFNRIRYLSLFLTVFVLAIIARGNLDPTPMTMLVQAIGEVVGRAIDFPYSPVRLMTLMLSSTAPSTHIEQVRTAAGMAYLISLVMLSIFVIALKIFGWPASNGTFNVWVNLPTFDPTIGGDVVARLERDARVNLALGFLLPFLVPAVVKAASSSFGEVTLSTPQTLIWMVSAWAFLPASLFMRGIAMHRVAEMIREKRRQNDALQSRLQPA